MNTILSDDEVEQSEPQHNEKLGQLVINQNFQATTVDEKVIKLFCEVMSFPSNLSIKTYELASLALISIVSVDTNFSCVRNLLGSGFDS